MEWVTWIRSANTGIRKFINLTAVLLLEEDRSSIFLGEVTQEQSLVHFSWDLEHLTSLSPPGFCCQLHSTWLCALSARWVASVLWWGSWNYMTFKVSSNQNHSVSLWFYESSLIFMLNHKETREAIYLQNCNQISAAGVSTDDTSALYKAWWKTAKHPG